MFKIAYVEDEKDLAKLVIKYLKQEGYEVTHFDNGEDAQLNIDKKFDLWILDIMLPGGTNGYDLIKSIRKNHQELPVIFTSARDHDIDRVMGLELGSDDYISKPYSIRELVLRVKNLLNRTYKSRVNSSIIEYSPYKIDVDKRIVLKDNETISLTSKEYDLLLFFLENKGKAFSRDQVLEHVWGSEYFGSDRVVDDLMRRLRQKMPLINIETIYGFGYRLV
jgi:two-component system response regulator CssR